VENLPFGHKQTCVKTQSKIFTLLVVVFFPDLDKATIKPSREISHQKPLFPRNMDDYIRLTNVPKR